MTIRGSSQVFEKRPSESESLNARGLFSDVSVDLAALSLFGDVAGFMDTHTAATTCLAT